MSRSSKILSKKSPKDESKDFFISDDRYIYIVVALKIVMKTKMKGGTKKWTAHTDNARPEETS